MKHTTRTFHWHGYKKLASILLLGSVLMPHQARAQEAAVTIILRPHCEEATLPPGEECPLFEVESPDMLKTPALNAGDILDLDIVVENPTAAEIQRVRSWLAYDPSFLEGTKVEIAEGLIPTPDEDKFDNEQGYLQLETTSALPITAESIVIARISMKVLKSSTAGTALSFFNVQPEGNTAVYAQVNGDEVYALQSEPGTLHIVTGTAGGSTTSSASSALQSSPSGTSSSSSPASSLFPDGHACSSSNQCESQICSNSICTAGVATASSASSATRTAFTLLQVQNLRITTEDSNVFLAWNPLSSSSLKGYNLYYGTISGEYLQRRSIDAKTTSMTMQGLPEGTRYYFAVRAVGANDEESAYSQEVAVTVADPSTSTAPLLPGTFTSSNPVTKSPTVPGETGASSTIALFLMLSAVMGTIFAWRRQLSVSRA